MIGITSLNLPSCSLSTPRLENYIVLVNSVLLRLLRAHCVGLCAVTSDSVLFPGGIGQVLAALNSLQHG